MIRKLNSVKWPELTSVTGFGFLIAGTWTWLGTAAGLAAIGVALLLIAWMVEE